MFPETKSRETIEDSKAKTGFPPAVTPPLYSYHSYNHQYEYYKNKNNNGTKLPCVWILNVMFHRSNSINMGNFFYLFISVSRPKKQRKNSRLFTN